MGVVMVTWPFLKFAVCRDPARRAGLSATADPCYFCEHRLAFYVSVKLSRKKTIAIRQLYRNTASKPQHHATHPHQQSTNKTRRETARRYRHLEILFTVGYMMVHNDNSYRSKFCRPIALRKFTTAYIKSQELSFTHSQIYTVSQQSPLLACYNFDIHKPISW